MSSAFGTRLALVALVAGIPPAASGQGTDTASYPFNGVPVPIVLHLDSLAVVPRPGISVADLQGAVAPLGLALGSVTDVGLPIFGLPSPRTRDDLWVLARQVETSPAVERAGIVARHRAAGMPFMVSHQFIVRFWPHVAQTVIDSMNQANGVAVIRVTPGDARRLILEGRPAATMDPLELVAEYDRSSLTRLAQPDFGGVIVGTDGGSGVPDPLTADQWHLSKIDAAGAWAITTGDPSVIIAVVEVGGFEALHPDLAANVAASWDEVLDQASFPPGDRAHGTAAAGLAAAIGNNSVGGSGVCPQCRLLLVRGGSLGNISTMTDALRHARQNGATIISNSWTLPLTQATDIVLEQEAAVNQGIVVVQSMQNIGAITSVRDRCQDVGFAVAYLAASDANIGVGSSTDQDHLAVHSSEGPCLDILAPGAAHHAPGAFTGQDTRWGVATTDELGALGYNSAQLQQDLTDVSGEKRCPWAPGSGEFSGPSGLDYTKCFGGNSAATPIVAGVVGLMLSAKPGLCPDQVLDILRRTADKIDAAVAGYVPVPPDPLGRSNAYGYGRVNARRAVQEAQATTPTTSCGAAPPPQAAAHIEVGARLGVTWLSSGPTDETETSGPGGGPLAKPVFHVTWFPITNAMLEGQLGFATRAISGGADTRSAIVGVQAAFVVPFGGFSAYLGPSVALQAEDVGSGWTTEWGIGGAVGLRYPVLPFLALRVEFRYRYWSGLNLKETGMALGLGVVF